MTQRRAQFVTVAAGAVCLAAPSVSGQSLHETDIVVRESGESTIEFGLPAEGGPEWGLRVAGARLDESQFANLTDDPGFDSQSGAFDPSTALGFDLLGPLLLWDGESFASADPDYAMSVTKGDRVATTPAAEGRVEGFTFGAADAGGRFHHHVRFFLSPYQTTAIDGLWLLTLELWSPSPSVLPSEPLYMVFASGAEAVAQQQDAIAWVEQNLLGPSPCNEADLGEPYGQLDLSDINAFVTAFTGLDPIADLAEPFGQFDLSDINVFVSSFTAGCP